MNLVVGMREGATLEKVRVLIPMFEAEIRHGAIAEGMRKTAPQNPTWAQQAQWHREAAGQRTFQPHQAEDATGEPDE